MRSWFLSLRKNPNRPPAPGSPGGMYSDDEQGYGSRPTDSLLRWEPGMEKISRHEPARRRAKITDVLQYLIAITIALGNLILLLLILVGRIRIVAIDPMALPPRMDVNTPQIFHPETRFTIFSQDRGAAAWKQMTENFNIGSVYVPHHREHGLFDSELNSTIPGYENYPVAMYHQLHCLGTIRQMFYTLNVTAEMAYGNHVGHCFEYLRQSLTCNADLTLEYTAVGWEVEHLCKNPKDVQVFMKEYNKGNKAYPIIR